MVVVASAGESDRYTGNSVHWRKHGAVIPGVLRKKKDQESGVEADIGHDAGDAEARTHDQG